MKTAAERGVRVGLSRPVVSDHGQAFEVTALFQELAALEHARHTNEADKDFQKFLGKLGELIGHPTKTELFEILVPFINSATVTRP